MARWDIASTHQLPTGWAHDPLIATEIRTRIHHLARTGHGPHEIARRIGISSRTVTRTLHGHR